jgi:hypothetical protein
VGLVSLAMDSRIVLFYRQYLQQVDVKKLIFPPDNVLLNSRVQYQLNRYLFDVHSMFPSELGNVDRLPMFNYRKRVAKELMRRIEGAILDPNEDVGQFLFFPSSLFYVALASDVLDVFRP